ncbi:MAG TPA: Replicase polyprotein 1ab, partial [Micromonosporaceae bacterium]|nr:Replicase polyprotein 1ab [Micromonosporaceae bacterium]
VLADCERALGRPERAIDLFRSADRRQMSPAEAIELLIVAAGARSDLGQHDAAVAMLQVRELTSTEPWVARLRYAYADALLRVSRRAEAREWFARAAEADEYAETDAAERLLELDGVLLEDDTDTDDVDADDSENHDPDTDDADADDPDTDDPDTDDPDTDADDALGRDPFTSFGVKKVPLHDTGEPE